MHIEQIIFYGNPIEKSDYDPETAINTILEITES